MVNVFTGTLQACFKTYHHSNNFVITCKYDYSITYFIMCYCINALTVIIKCI